MKPEPLACPLNFDLNSLLAPEHFSVLFEMDLTRMSRTRPVDYLLRDFLLEAVERFFFLGEPELTWMVLEMPDSSVLDVSQFEMTSQEPLACLLNFHLNSLLAPELFSVLFEMDLTRMSRTRMVDYLLDFLPPSEHSSVLEAFGSRWMELKLDSV